MNTSPPWALLNHTLARLLAADPDTAAALARMAPCTVKVDVRGVTVVGLYIDGDEVRLDAWPDTAEQSDIAISASPLTLLKLLRARPEEVVADGESLSVSGDVTRLARLRQCLSGLDVDWEELLAERVGDVAAHQLGNALRRVAADAASIHADMRDNVSEYLRYELRAAVDPSELDGFNRAVDVLRDDVERLQARVRVLQRRVGQARLPEADA